MASGTHTWQAEVVGAKPDPAFPAVLPSICCGVTSRGLSGDGASKEEQETVEGELSWKDKLMGGEAVVMRPLIGEEKNIDFERQG